MAGIRLVARATLGATALLGAWALGAQTLHAECSDYRPPPPPPWTQPTAGGADPMGGDPFSGAGGTGTPTTGGGETGGPTTGGGRTGGPITRGTDRGGGGGGLEVGHWSHWWYANRVFLIEEGVRVSTHTTRTGETVPGTASSLWRAEARRALAAALSDENDEVVAAAVLALGKAGDASDVPLVVKIAADAKRGDPEREHAAMALGLLRAETRADAAAVRKTLRAIVADESNSERLQALATYALGLRQEEGAVPFLADRARAGAKSWDVPAAGLSALGLTGSEAALGELERVLAEARGPRQTMRRCYAAHGLAKLGDAAAAPALLTALEDEDENVRRAAALALADVAPVGDRKVVRALRRVLEKDDDRAVRAMAAVSLGSIGGDEALSALRKCFDRADASLRPYAAVALGVLARNSGRPEIARPLLRDLKRGTRQELLGATCVAVGLAGFSEAAPLLREVVEESGNPQVVAQAAVSIGLVGDRGEGLALLRGLLTTAHDPMVRGEVALALGMLGDAESIDALQTVVRDGGTESERISACVGLGRIGGAESAEVLIAVLANEKRSRLERHMAGNALGMLLDPSEGRRVGSVPAGLNWHVLTPTVVDVLSEM